jgi:hypothetical protein
MSLIFTFHNPAEMFEAISAVLLHLRTCSNEYRTIDKLIPGGGREESYASTIQRPTAGIPGIGEKYWPDGGSPNTRVGFYIPQWKFHAIAPFSQARSLARGILLPRLDGLRA